MIAPTYDTPRFGGTADVFDTSPPEFGWTPVDGHQLRHRPYFRTAPSTDARRQFLRLVEEWHAATDSLSSSSEIAMNAAYQRIIGMGMVAVPFILEDLRHRGGHWFWALRAIVGVAPYGREDAGNVPRMKSAWLRWGRERNLLSE